MTQPQSLLVAEDSRIQAKILEEKLQGAGYHVRVAENGSIALEMIRAQRPDLVISDIEMPEMTGYELCRAVKNDPELRTIPFILLSTLSEPEDIIRGLHSGADNYVTKPYDPDFLLSRVQSALAVPLQADDGEQQQLDVTLAGTRYTVAAGRQQVLNLLVSTFENAVEKNRELARTNEELSVAKEQLTRSNETLANLNRDLESANTRMAHDLDAAAKVQQSLLPTSIPETPHFSIAWKYLPCDELAGDFLNVLRLDDRHLAAFVVDVSGHGVASSLLSVTIGRLLTAQVSTSSLLIRETAQGNQVTPPAEVACELNRRFPMEEQNDLYFTMLYGVLDTETGEFRFVSAGHDPVVHLQSSGPPRFLEGSNLPIGWVDGAEYDEQSLQLDRGDRLMLYSDGVPEAMNAELEQFGMPRMLEVIELGRAQSLDENVDLLLDTVQRWCRVNGPKDDVSILGLEMGDRRAQA